MKTAESLINLVLKKKKERQDGSGHWARAEILDRLNDFQSVLETKLSNLIRSIDSSLSTVIGQAYVNLPTTVKRVLAITYDGGEINFTTEDDLQDRATKGELPSNWRSESGTPTDCYQRGNQLYFYPIPTAVAALGISCYVNLTAMTDSASSYPLNNQEQLNTAQLALVYLVLMDLCAEDGDSKLDGFAALYNSVFDTIQTEMQLKRRNNKPGKRLEYIQNDDR